MQPFSRRFPLLFAQLERLDTDNFANALRSINNHIMDLKHASPRLKFRKFVGIHHTAIVIPVENLSGR